MGEVVLPDFVVAGSKALCDTLLILWALRGKPRARTRLGAALSIGVGAFLYWMVDYIVVFSLPPLLYIVPTLVACIGAMALACSLIDRPLPASCLIAGTASLCLSMVQSLVVTIVLHTVGDISGFVHSTSLENFLLEPLCCLLTLPVVSWMRRTTERRGVRAFHFSQLAWLLPALGVYLVITLWQIPHFEEAYTEIPWLPIVLMGLMVALGIIVLLMPLYLSESLRQRHEMERMELLVAQYYESVQFQRRSDDEVRRTVHDLRNQINCALENIDNVAGRRQLQEVSSRLDDLRFIAYTGNPTLDTILNQRRRLAAASGIAFSVVPCPLPSDLITDSDLCAIACNALDNAFEECARLSADTHRYIDVKLACQGAFATIVFANSCSPSEESGRLSENALHTSKPDAALHGIGLSSIRYCVEKHGGSLAIDRFPNEFRLSILIPLHENGREDGAPSQGAPLSAFSAK